MQHFAAESTQGFAEPTEYVLDKSLVESLTPLATVGSTPVPKTGSLASKPDHVKPDYAWTREMRPLLALLVLLAVIVYLRIRDGFRWINDRVVTYRWARFQQLRREYITLPPTQGQPNEEPIKSLLKRFSPPEVQKEDPDEYSHARKSTPPVEWQDLFEIELAFLKAQPLEVLHARGWKYRSDYKDVVGERVYALYDANLKERLKSPDISQQTPPDLQVYKAVLLADLEFVLSELYRLYNLQMAREEARSLLLIIISGGAGLVLALVFLGLGLPYYAQTGSPDEVPFILLVAVAGALGGFVSTQIRLQDTTLDDRPLSNLIGLVYGRASIYLAPINGFLFATLLYLIFAGGLLTGTIFPAIGVPVDPVSPDTVVKVIDFLKHSGPKTGVAFAEMLVWAFAAGFAERLVPDTIDRLIAKTKDINQVARKS